MADFDWSQYSTQGAQRPDSFSGMNSDFSSSLARMFQEAPPSVRAQLQVSSGYRSPARQKQLWNQALAKYGSPEVARRWVAPPGNSQHNKGYAADLKYLSPDAKAWVKTNAPTYGLDFPLSNEPWHVELAGARGKKVAGYPVPSGTIPTPTSAPDIEGILSGGTPTAVQNSVLGTAPVTAVSRSALSAPVTEAFDNGRFGDPVFDAGRFAPTASTTYTPGQLRTALQEQAAVGQPSVQAPSIQNATVQAPTPQQMATNGLLSMPEQRAVAAQKAYLESQPERAVSALSKLNLGNVLGTVGPAVLGGLALGPLGALAGGYLGNKVTNAVLQQPEAPKSKPKGDGSLTNYGRSVQGSSGQFSRALASGGKGLY